MNSQRRSASAAIAAMTQQIEEHGLSDDEEPSVDPSTKRGQMSTGNTPRTATRAKEDRDHSNTVVPSSSTVVLDHHHHQTATTKHRRGHALGQAIEVSPKKGAKRPISRSSDEEEPEKKRATPRLRPSPNSEVGYICDETMVDQSPRDDIQQREYPDQPAAQPVVRSTDDDWGMIEHPMPLPKNSEWTSQHKAATVSQQSNQSTTGDTRTAFSAPTTQTGAIGDNIHVASKRPDHPPAQAPASPAPLPAQPPTTPASRATATNSANVGMRTLCRVGSMEGMTSVKLSFSMTVQDLFCAVQQKCKRKLEEREVQALSFEIGGGKWFDVELDDEDGWTTVIHAHSTEGDDVVRQVLVIV